jgi:hypothetical protein
MISDGRWMATVFGGDSTAPFACSLGFIELDIRADGDDVLVKELHA